MMNSVSPAPALLLLLLPSILLLLSSGCAMAERNCGNCGPTPVPYPLSTGLDCGDQSYKIRCDSSGLLWFDALYGTSFVIPFITPETRRFVIHPANNNVTNWIPLTNVAFQLNTSLPFQISGSNTIIYFNCTDRIRRRSPFDCNNSSFCYTYIRDTPELTTAYEKGRHRVCCSFRTGGSAGSRAYNYTLRVRQEGCGAYRSFVNLDASLPVRKWPAPGMEIQWLLPHEPICRTQADCEHDGGFESSCEIDPNTNTTEGRGRCVCKAGLWWDAVAGQCNKRATCQTSRGCDDHESLIKLILEVIGALISSTATIWGVVNAFRRPPRGIPRS